MAKRLHRDSSSLSRFERGLNTPRDLDAVVAAYEALVPHPDSHPTPRAYLVTTVVRWLALGAASLVSSSGALEAVRVFVAASAALLLITVGRQTLTSRPGLMRCALTTLPIIVLIAYTLSDLNERSVRDLLPLIPAQLWIELSLFVWTVQKDDRQLRPVLERDRSESESNGVVIK